MSGVVLYIVLPLAGVLVYFIGFFAGKWKEVRKREAIRRIVDRMGNLGMGTFQGVGGKIGLCEDCRKASLLYGELLTELNSEKGKSSE